MGQIFSSHHHVVERLSELGPEELRAALTVVGKYLKKKKMRLVIVVVGGALNTLYLGSRRSTHDVDFLSRDLGFEELQIFRHAVDKASTTMGAPQEWLNNQTSVFLKYDTRMRLLEEATTANEVVFQSGGLIVVAAPWRYCLCSKLNRIHRSIDNPAQRREYDAADAAAYLRHIVQARGGPVPHAVIVGWLDEFELEGADIIGRLDDVYQDLFHTAGVV